MTKTSARNLLVLAYYVAIAYGVAHLLRTEFVNKQGGDAALGGGLHDTRTIPEGAA